jgi:hypothetical protein
VLRRRRTGLHLHLHLQRPQHGAGKQQAIDNTRQLAESWLEQARANGQDITRAELAADALHEPLFTLGTS